MLVYCNLLQGSPNKPDVVEIGRDGVRGVGGKKDDSGNSVGCSDFFDMKTKVHAGRLMPKCSAEVIQTALSGFTSSGLKKQTHT